MVLKLRQQLKNKPLGRESDITAKRDDLSYRAALVTGLEQLPRSTTTTTLREQYRLACAAYTPAYAAADKLYKVFERL